MPYGQTAPTINPNTFPYHRKWTTAETDELIERIDRLREVMVDMVGPSGVQMWLDPGSVANIAAHLALAGADVNDEQAYIWAERQADDVSMMQDTYVWHVKSDVEPPEPEPVDPELVQRQAEAARAQIRKQLPPEVQKLLIANLAKEFEHDTTEGQQ